MSKDRVEKNAGEETAASGTQSINTLIDEGLIDPTTWEVFTNFLRLYPAPDGGDDAGEWAREELASIERPYGPDVKHIDGFSVRPIRQCDIPKWLHPRDRTTSK